jgi:hypothetical protein
VDPITLSFATPDPAVVTDGTPTGTSPFQCAPPVTVEAQGSGQGAVARWVGMSIRVLSASEDYRQSFDSAFAVGFWEETQIVPGQTVTKANQGFAWNEPIRITIRFRYRRLPLDEVREDSVVTHCGAGAPS